ncbi:hypothetical protein D3C76_1231420 [compost metagenome]
MLPLVEVGEAGNLAVQQGDRTAPAFGHGGGELADGERPTGLGIGEEEFVRVLGEEDDFVEVVGAGGAVLQL